MEEKIHFAYIHGLYHSLKYTNGDYKGEEVQIIHKGEHNHDGGPDFFNAKIRYGDFILVGNVEIHIRGSDWVQHNHHMDASYNNVILHIVIEDDCEIIPGKDSTPILTAKMDLDNGHIHIGEKINKLTATPLCKELINLKDHDKISDTVKELGKKRMKSKAQRLNILLQATNYDWNEAVYILLSRHFGGSVNNDAFEQIAKQIPYAFIRKERGRPKMVEALLMGTAGLLNKREDRYATELQKDYNFLKQKYHLSELADGCVRFHRIRPAAFPTIKLAQLAALLTEKEFIFSDIIHAKGIRDIRLLFATPQISTYWQEHYRFGHKRKKVKNRSLTTNAINHCICNVVCPTLIAYGNYIKEPLYTTKAINLLKETKAECNKITRYFESVLTAQNALESQGLILLYSKYCQINDCFVCPIINRQKYL